MSARDGGVEILMAVHNGSAFLKEQIDSIIRQTDGRWHLTISDDGSTDDSREIIDDYARRCPDKIAHLRSGRRFGNARDHFFFLMEHCDSEYMLFCDQDDVWYPDKVKKTRQALLDAEEKYGSGTPILVFSDQVPTDAALNPLADSLMRYQNQYREDFDFRSLLMQNVVTGGAMGINRALAEMARPPREAGTIIMHDWWLAVVAAKFGRIIYLDEPLGAYRQHGDNAVGAKAVGSARYISERLSALGEVRRSILRKKAQAETFRRAYQDRLSDEEALYLRQFARKHSGMGFYLRHMGLIHGTARRVGMLLLG